MELKIPNRQDRDNVTTALVNAGYAVQLSEKTDEHSAILYVEYILTVNTSL